MARKINPDRLERLLNALDAPHEQEAPGRVDAAELASLGQLRGILQASIAETKETGLRPFLADRVLRHFRADQPNVQDLYWRELLLVFRPIMVAGALLIVLLTSYNLSTEDVWVEEQTVTEAVFGLPPITPVSAFDLVTID